MSVEKSGRFQILSREGLRIIAIFLMLSDHAYMTVVNVAGYHWMTQIGRIAFPIFAFQIAEGYRHSSNQNKYLRNMFLFALLSEIPYNLMMGGSVIGPMHQNVMFTFVIAISGLMLIDRIRALNTHILVKILLLSGLCVLSVIIGTITFVDYSGFGVLTVLIFYMAKLLPNKYLTMLFQFAGLWLINWVWLGGRVLILPNGFEFPQQGLALLSLVFIWMYSGKKALDGTAGKVFKYFSYFFYPLHILVLSLIAMYLL